LETLLRDGEIRAARPPVAGMGHLTRINGTPDYKLCPWVTKGGSWAVPGTAVNAGTDPDRDDGGEPGSDADAGKQALSHDRSQSGARSDPDQMLSESASP